MVTADVVGLYPRIPHEAGLKTLEKALNNGTNKKFSTKDLVKMAKFVLKNNYVEFNGKVKQQISGTPIGTKFTPPYAWIFMEKVDVTFVLNLHMSQVKLVSS